MLRLAGGETATGYICIWADDGTQLSKAASAEAAAAAVAEITLLLLILLWA